MRGYSKVLLPMEAKDNQWMVKVRLKKRLWRVMK